MVFQVSFCFPLSLLNFLKHPLFQIPVFPVSPCHNLIVPLVHILDFDLCTYTLHSWNKQLQNPPQFIADWLKDSGVRINFCCEGFKKLNLPQFRANCFLILLVHFDTVGKLLKLSIDSIHNLIAKESYSRLELSYDNSEFGSVRIFHLSKIFR